MLVRLRHDLRGLPRLLLLLALLLGAQYAALLHGTQHPFHDHERACDLYCTADHQGQAPAGESHSATLPAASLVRSTFPPRLPTVTFAAAYQARAPPAHR